MKFSIRAAVGLALFALSLAVAAQAGIYRQLPPAAKKGELAGTANDWKIVIDGKTYPMAPGIRIRDTRNMIVVPFGIGGPSVVRYTRDQTGAVDNVWLLTRDEIALPEPKQ